MAERVTFDDLWADLKEENEQSQRVFEAAETVSDVIHSIVEARINKGWSQRDLARESGMKQAAIARIERLQVMPRIDTVAKLAACVGIRIKANSKLGGVFPGEEKKKPLIAAFIGAERTNSINSVEEEYCAASITQIYQYG